MRPQVTEQDRLECDQHADAIAELGGGFQRHRSAERMTDQGDRPGCQRGGCGDELGLIRGGERPRGRPGAGVAVAEQVDRDHAVAALQALDERPPLAQPARGAVNQNDGRASPGVRVFEVESLRL